MMTPIPIPVRLTKLLSTRAHRILERESIQSCEELLTLRETDLFLLRGSGKKTVRELMSLQGRILEKYPHLLSHYSKEQKVTPLSTKMPDKGPAVGPADWSILNRTLPDLCQLSPIPFPYQLEPETSIDSLRLPATDLERLRSIAVFPEDSIHLLYSITTGYLIQTGLSDVAISIMLAASARISGPAGAALQSRSKQNVPDVSLYAELPSDLMDQLVVPGFRFPALLGIANSDTPTVPWSAVAKITERTVIRKLGISVAALRAIRYLWQLQERAVSIAESVRAGLPTKAYGDFAQLAEGYLQLAVAKKCDPLDHECAVKYRQVLRARLRMVDGRKWKLYELGQQYGVTRERIRQIESKLLAVLKSPETRQHLDYLWHLLDRLLVTGGGVRYLSELCVSLRDIQGWPHLPSEEALGSIMELSPKYQVVWDSPIRVALTGPCCVGCTTSRRAVLRAVETTRDMVLSVDEALEIMLEICQKERCPELGKITGFSKSLFHCRAGSTAEIMVQGEKLCLPDARHRKVADRHHMLEQIVLAAGDGIHFKEVQRQFKRAVPGAPVTEQMVYGWLFENPSLLLWGHGTFKHRDLVRVPTALIAEIQQDLLARLDSDDIPYICLNGTFFNNYRDRLRMESVPNPLALYTSMRIVGSATVTFTEYPYVVKKDGSGLRRSISALVEGFVSSHAGPVAAEQVRAFAISKLGVPAEQVGYYLSKVRNVERDGRGLWLHCNNVPMVTDRLGMIVRKLSKLEPGGPIDQEWLYRENHAACQVLGITRPAQLTSLIERYLPGRIEISRRKKVIGATGRTAPRVTASTARRKPAAKPPRVPVARQVLSYLEEQAKPCKTKELFDLFRDRTSCPDYLYTVSLGDKENILWYTKDSVIARRALEWSREKQAAIEALACRHQEQRAKRAKPYGLCSEIYREMGGELPEIAPHLSWTPVLLQSLLGSGFKFAALGRQRDVFISKSNTHHIATLDDLIFYTLLTDYGGTASIRAFISRLRGNSLMDQKMPGFLKGKDRRVIIEGDVIRAADLDTAPGDLILPAFSR